MREGAYLGLSATGFHRLAYTEWGDENAPRTVVCVHGLTRNGRDFDPLAKALAESGCRVACPDVVGRGRSDWLEDAAGYGYPQSLADTNALVARLGVAAIDWIGTSMGGLIGMMMAAQAKTPIRKLVINDVGPLVPLAALERLATYLGSDPHFPDLATAEAHIREIHTPFGKLSDAQWRHLTEHSVRSVEGGGYRFRYDPRLKEAFQNLPPVDVDLWHVWDAIRVPTLVLRGAESDLLLPETAAAMTTRGPKVEIVEIPDCGHAPALMDKTQIGIIRDWLRR